MDSLGFDRIFPRAFYPDRTKAPWGIEEIYNYAMFFDSEVARIVGQELAAAVRCSIEHVKNTDYFMREKPSRYPKSTMVYSWAAA